ncbi:MAG: SPOR domain-containing protein [Myxococcota bacterium]
MRDLDKIKEKTTLHLDRRQIFGIFVGSALVTTGIFVAGVWVGKNLAAPTAPDLEGDPLAVIDQMGAEEESLSFERGLLKAAPALEPPAAVRPPPGPKPQPVPIAAPAPTRAAPASAPAPSPVPIPALAPASAKPASRPPVTPAAPEPTAGEPGYTLQLSSFQERREADDFVRALAEKGYSAYVVSSEIPGKGLWYRVRLGDFGSHKDALEAKYDFERKQHVIAYVTKKQ